MVVFDKTLFLQGDIADNRLSSIDHLQRTMVFGDGEHYASDDAAGLGLKNELVLARDM